MVRYCVEGAEVGEALEDCLVEDDACGADRVPARGGVDVGVEVHWLVGGSGTG